MAAIGLFQRELVLANHHAIGVPINSKSSVTVLASFKVSQIVPMSAADKLVITLSLICLSDITKRLHDEFGWVAFQKFDKCQSSLVVFGLR